MTGIVPLNRHIFKDCEYAPSLVTDHPAPLHVTGELSHTDSEAHSSNNSAAESVNIEPANDFNLNSASTSQANNSLLDNPVAINTFSPEIVRPLPKGTQAPSTRGRKKGKSAVLTSSPVRNELAQKKKAKGKKKVASIKKSGPNKTSKKTKSSKKQAIEDSDEDDCFCLVCLDKYSESASGAQWVKCNACRGWAHVGCVRDDIYFICQNCESE